MMKILNKYENAVKTFFESKYFLGLISILTILNFSFNIGMWTYIEVGIILSLMMLFKSRFNYLPSIVIFILGGGLSKVPNFKSFSFVLACVVGVILIATLFYFIYCKRKEVLCITISNSFIITTILLAISMLLSMITSVKPLTTLAATGGFLINLLVMYFVLLTVKITDDSKEELANSFVAIFYVIFIMVVIHFFKLLPNHAFKDLFFDKKLFHLGWDYSNHYCAMMNISFIFACYILITKWYELTWYQKLYFIFPLIGTTLVSILLSSRGSLLGLIGSVGAAFILIIIKNRKNKKFVITMCSIAIVGVCILATLYFTGVFDLFGDKRADCDNHLNGRQELWPVAWRHFKENWLLGTGYGTQRIFILSETPQIVYNYHNYFFQISTAGIIGVICFLVYLVNIVWHCIKKIDWYLIAFVSILATFMISGFVDTLFFSNKMMPLFSICLCYMDLKPKELAIQDKWIYKLSL